MLSAARFAKLLTALIATQTHYYIFSYPGLHFVRVLGAPGVEDRLEHVRVVADGVGLEVVLAAQEQDRLLPHVEHEHVLQNESSLQKCAVLRLLLHKYIWLLQQQQKLK